MIDNKNSNINIRHLIAALEVRKLGSISKASSQIHLSQPAVTKAIIKLEETIGLPLFIRSSKGLFATEAGEVFLKRVERATLWLKDIYQVFGKPGDKKSIEVRRPFNNTQLRALIAVVEHQSYTLAAHQLGLAQPTVHRAVQDIETSLDHKLFQRSPVGVEPLWQARKAAAFASLFFSELNQGIDEVWEHQGMMTGSLRIGSLPLARTRIIPEAVIRLLKRLPETQVCIIDGSYEELLHHLLQGQIDMIVGALRVPSPSPDIRQEKLFTDSLCIVVRPGHPLATAKAYSAEQLHQLDWIVPRENAPARLSFTRFFTDKGLSPPEHVIECSSLVATRGLLLNSDRAALLPARQVEVEIKHGILAISPQPLTSTDRDIGITLRKDWKPTRVQQYFIDQLRLIS